MATWDLVSKSNFFIDVRTSIQPIYCKQNDVLVCLLICMNKDFLFCLEWKNDIWSLDRMLTLTAYVTPSLARTASGWSQPRAGFATNELSAISPNTEVKSHRLPPNDILHTSLTLSYFKCAFIVIQIINSRTRFDSGHSQMDNIHLRYTFHSFITVTDRVNNS